MGCDTDACFRLWCGFFFAFKRLEIESVLNFGGGFFGTAKVGI